MVNNTKTMYLIDYVEIKKITRFNETTPQILKYDRILVAVGRAREICRWERDIRRWERDIRRWERDIRIWEGEICR